MNSVILEKPHPFPIRTFLDNYCQCPVLFTLFNFTRKHGATERV